MFATSCFCRKSVLVDELHKHIVRSHGLFARGKFDPYKTDSSCLLGAFRHLILSLQVSDPVTWKVRLLRALGPNAAVMTNLLPELSRLLGEVPPVGHLVSRATRSVALGGAVFSLCPLFVLFLSPRPRQRRVSNRHSSPSCVLSLQPLIHLHCLLVREVDKQECMQVNLGCGTLTHPGVNHVAPCRLFHR